MIVTKEHFEYLKIQHGKIGKYLDNFEEWKIQYNLSLEKIYNNIKPYIPNNVENVLDIGGGFSGISAKIGGDISLTVIDGIDDPPHRSGISNNAMLAKEFLSLNGVFKSEFVHPKDHKKITKKFDLIYSFASYPFHVFSEEYEDLLFKNSHDDTVFIFEVRRGYELPLDTVIVIFEEPKYERVVACRPQ